jgi:hypothetical protein
MHMAFDIRMDLLLISWEAYQVAFAYIAIPRGNEQRTNIAIGLNRDRSYIERSGTDSILLLINQSHSHFQSTFRIEWSNQ